MLLSKEVFSTTSTFKVKDPTSKYLGSRAGDGITAVLQH